MSYRVSQGNSIEAGLASSGTRQKTCNLLRRWIADDQAKTVIAQYEQRHGHGQPGDIVEDPL